MGSLAFLFTTWYGSLIVSVALSLASFAYTKHREHNQRAGLPDGAKVKGNTRGTNEDIMVVYGEFKIGANAVYIEATGYFNFDLYYCHALCVGPIEGIESDGNPMIWFGGERVHSKYVGYNMWGTPLYAYQEKTGTSTQTANTVISALTDPMHNIAYVAWKLGFDRDKYRGIPTIHYLVKGLLLYDFRDTTTAWSDNPVLALYDYFTNDQYGMGRSASILELVSWEAAADYCDDKGFTINAVYFSKDNVWANVNQIMDLFRGELTYWDGQYSLKFRDLNEEASVMTITDEHIAQDGDGKAIISLSDPGSYNLPTGVRVTYIRSDDNSYVDDSFIIGEESDLLIEYNAAGATNREQAGIMGLYHLERAKLNRTISGQFRDNCLVLEPNDIVTLNTTALSISDQAMRVVSSSYANNGLINLTFQYESLDLYDDVYNINEEAIYSTTLPDPSDAGVIEDAAVSEDTYYYRLRTLSRLNITFTIPEDSWFDHVEVLVSTNGDVEANYTNQFNATDNFSIDPVEEGIEYFIILRVVNIFGAKQALSAATKVSRLVIGKSDTVPDSLANFSAIAGDGSVSLRADKLDDPDIEIYEFRIGDQWNGGIFLSAKRSPNEELGSVKPGLHTFLCNTKGTNGLYGASPRDDSATVEVKKGWSALTSFTDDYSSTTSGQSLTNVGPITYAGDEWIKCSHDPQDSEISNGGFDSATTDWTLLYSTLASIAGGESGNCLEITRVSDDYQRAYQDITTIIGQEYQLAAYVKTGSSGDEAYIIGAYEDDWTLVDSESGTTSSSWVEDTLTFTATAATTRIAMVKNTATAGTMLFDTVSCKLTNELFGQYISEEFDTGVAAASYFVFLDSEFVTVGAGTAWEDVLLSNDSVFTTDYTTDIVTVTGHTYLATKPYFLSTTTTLPDPLEVETEYYIRDITTNTFKFSLTEGGSAINLTDDGTGTHTISQVATWEDINANSRSWLDIFEIEEAPQITVRIGYKATIGDDWSYIEDAQILAAVVNARYFKVEINITDPGSNVNGYAKEFSLELYN